MIEPRTSIIDTRLKSIKRIIAVASGKGGVGKSFVASSLAVSLSKKGYRVGLLDLDFYGPSVHIILGAYHLSPREEKGLIPPKIQGISFMSIVHFTEDKPAPFRGEDISNIILELLAVTQWGSLDFLIIDMPPGLGEETLDIIRYMKRIEFIVVTTPSKVSMGAVKKLLLLLKEVKKPILGVVENMTMTPLSLVKEEVRNFNVPYLGSIPFDENLENALGDIDRIKTTKAMKHIEKILSKIIH